MLWNVHILFPFKKLIALIIGVYMTTGMPVSWRMYGGQKIILKSWFSSFMVGCGIKLRSLDLCGKSF